MINFNQEQAANAGIGTGAQESGAYIGLIYAEWITATTGTKGIEFSMRGEHDINYLTCYYAKSDGSDVRGGLNIIQAIMGILNIQQISERVVNGQDNQPVTICPELHGKPIGLVLQKILTTKNDGSDGYKFEIVMPFHDKSNQTYIELANRQPPQQVEKILATLKDKDQRKPVNQFDNAGGYGGNNGYGDPQNAPAPRSKLNEANEANRRANQANQQGREPNLDDDDYTFFGGG